MGAALDSGHHQAGSLGGHRWMDNATTPLNAINPRQPQNRAGIGSCVGITYRYCSLVYSTAIRANGAGWALGIGRIGAIVGPLIGGSLIAAHVKLQFLFMVPTVPLFIGAVASTLLAGSEDEMPRNLENA